MPSNMWERLFRTDAVFGIMTVVVALGGWSLGKLEGIPLTYVIPAVLLTLCALLWLWDRYASPFFLKRSAGPPQPSLPPPAQRDPAPASLQQQPPPHPLAIAFQHGLPDHRIVRDDAQTNPGLFDVVKVRIANLSDKPMREIEFSATSRSHVLDGAKPYFIDYGPVFVAGRRKKTELSPGAFEDYVIMSRNYFDPSQLALGTTSRST